MLRGRGGQRLKVRELDKAAGHSMKEGRGESNKQFQGGAAECIKGRKRGGG